MKVHLDQFIQALQHLGYGDESNAAFSSCLSICDTYGKGWLTWGVFCDRCAF